MSAEMENVRNTFKETLKLNEKYLKCSCVSYGKSFQKHALRKTRQTGKCS